MSVSHTDHNQLHGAGDLPPYSIVRAEGQRVLHALERLVSPRPDTTCRKGRWFLDWSKTNAVDLSNLWALIDTKSPEMPAATALAVPSPGRTAMVLASSPRSAQEVEPHGDLIRHATARLQDVDVTLGQAMLDPSELREEKAFLAGGYERLAKLSFLERAMPSKRDQFVPEWPTSNFTLETWEQERRDDWISALELSYEDTLDCPGLVGLRDTSDILDGHMATGEFEPELWTLLRIDGRPVGVSMFNPSPTSMKVELVYLGLGKLARGQGLARALLHHSLSSLVGRAERMVALAVDDENEPALRTYRRVGFRRVQRRTAYIQPVERAVVESRSESI